MADDLISRQAAIDLFPNDVLEWDTNFGYIAPHFARRMIEELPSAQSETEGLFEWCHDCKEYDRKAHCCHRWTKVIRKTVDEIKAEPVRHGKWIHEVRYTIDSLHSYQQYRCSECDMTYITNTKYCPNCGARMVEDE